MNITEFLEARITEDEAEADYLLGREDNDANAHGEFYRAECVAKRAIIKQHEEWPVLVEREPEGMIFDANAVSNLTFRMSREIAWLTEREYVKRFGVEPPTTPMLRTLAAIYADHEDYLPEWAL